MPSCPQFFWRELPKSWVFSQKFILYLLLELGLVCICKTKTILLADAGVHVKSWGFWVIFTKQDTKDFLRNLKKRYWNKDYGIGFLIQTFHFCVPSQVVSTPELGTLKWGKSRGLRDKILQIHHLIQKNKYTEGVRKNNETKTQSVIYDPIY